jgi:hypothetical protein
MLKECAIKKYIKGRKEGTKYTGNEKTNEYYFF